MVLKIFTQPNCPKCPAAKALVRELRIMNDELRIGEYDVSTVDGLAEASFYSVMATPSLILCDDSGKEIKTWRGTTPKVEEVKTLLK